MNAFLTKGVSPVFIALVAVSSATAAHLRKVGPKKQIRALVALRDTGTIRISFVALAPDSSMSGSQGNRQLNLGNVSYGGTRPAHGVTTKRAQSSFWVSTRIGLLLQDVGGRNIQTATVQAFVTNPSSKGKYRLDGIILTTTPRVITTHAPIGVVTAHRLQIEVSTHEAPGPIATPIGFLVTPN